jgi:hypothetical protein
VMLRLKPGLIGLEVDRRLELSGTRYKSKSRGKEISKSVTLCSSSNELGWSNVRSARESLPISGLRQEQFESHCRDPSHNCLAVGTQWYRHSRIVVQPCCLVLFM